MSDTFNTRKLSVRTAAELAEALVSGAQEIHIEATITGSPPLLFS